MAAKETAVAIEVIGLKDLLRVLNKLPKEFNAQIRDAASDIATDLKDSATAAARTPLQRLAASALRVKRDRVPIVRSGTTIVRPGTRANDIFFGAEFGGRRRPTTQQFLEHRGRRGYFLYPTARAHGSHYMDLWTKAIEKAMADWNYSPPAGSTHDG